MKNEEKADRGWKGGVGIMNEQSVKLDRMRYTKNTTSSRLALLAIVFDVLYFVSIYKSDVDPTTTTS